MMVPGGWGALLIASYAVTSSITLDAGFRSLSTDREQGNRDTLASSQRSLRLIAYGPVLGVGFRF